MLCHPNPGSVMTNTQPVSLLLLAALLACGGDDGVSAPEEVTITTEGGTVTSGDGKVTLVVPAGALAQTTAITITPAPASADARLVPGTEYVFEPDGLRFAVPARLTIRYDSIPAAMAEQAPYVWLHRRAGTGWTPMAGQAINTATRTIAGEIDGFSSFGGVVNQLAGDLLVAGLLLQALLTDAIAENAIALLQRIAAILQKQQDPAFQALAQPFLDAALTTACNAYATAVNTARNAPVDDWGVVTKLLEPVYAWEAVVAALGALDGCPNAPLTIDQIQTLKIQQFVTFYTTKLDPASFGQNFDRLVEEVRVVVAMRATVLLLGLAAADQKLLTDAQHPLMDEMRRAAYTACRNDGRHEYLGRLRNDVAAANYTDDQLLDDLQQCATRLTWTIAANDPSLDASGTLGGGITPGSQTVQVITPGLAQGSITLGGDVRAFMCSDGSFAPDELVVTLGGIEVDRRSHSGGQFFASPFQLDAAAILQTAGVDAGANAQVPLVIARVSLGCNQYVQSDFPVPIATLRLQYPAPQAIYQNDFSSAAGPEWNTQSLANSPSGERYLGNIVNGTARLSLLGLPSHSTLKVEIDLYLINTWGGNDPDFGPDLVTVSIDGTTLLTTTFSNEPEHRQAYPDPYPNGDYPAGTGAAAINSLGYDSGDEEDYSDSTYRLVFEVDHTAATVAFQVAASNLQAFPDEYWGIDNVRVTVK